MEISKCAVSAVPIRRKSEDISLCDIWYSAAPH